MSEERLNEIKDSVNFQRKLLLAHNMNTLCVDEEQELIEEIDRLNNIINRIDNFVDRTIEVIKQQPSENDEWILERLNGIKYLTELKENNK